MKPIKGFKTWCRHQTDRQDAVGDIARDIVRDENWPKIRSITRAVIYLSEYGADGTAIKACYAAWRGYEAQKELVS